MPEFPKAVIEFGEYVHGVYAQPSATIERASCISEARPELSGHQQIRGNNRPWPYVTDAAAIFGVGRGCKKPKFSRRTEEPCPPGTLCPPEFVKTPSPGEDPSGFTTSARWIARKIPDPKRQRNPVAKDGKVYDRAGSKEGAAKAPHPIESREGAIYDSASRRSDVQAGATMLNAGE